MARVEPLVTLRINAAAALHVLRVTEWRGTSIVVSLGPVGEDLGMVIGKGPTKLAALSDAQSNLQSALDMIDVAILKTQREN